MSTHCNAYPGCGCPPTMGEKCHLYDETTKQQLKEWSDQISQSEATQEQVIKFLEVLSEKPNTTAPVPQSRRERRAAERKK